MTTPHTATDQATDTIAWAHEYLDLTWEEVAAMLDTTSRTLQRWRRGDAVPGRDNLESLDAVEELRFWLAAVFENDHGAAQQWLRERMIDLHGKAPIHLLRSGRVAKISDLLATFHTGAFI